MKKIGYYILTIFVSIEAFIILTSLVLGLYFIGIFDSLARSGFLQADGQKILMGLPMGLAGWIFLELRQLIFENDASAKILTEWPDYWRLRIHVNVAFFYAVVFVLISIVPWIEMTIMKEGMRLLAIGVAIIGQLAVAVSVYFARFRIKEYLIYVIKPKS